MADDVVDVAGHPVPFVGQPRLLLRLADLGSADLGQPPTEGQHADGEDDDWIDNVFSASWDNGEIQCRARVVCKPPKPPAGKPCPLSPPPMS